VLQTSPLQNRQAKIIAASTRLRNRLRRTTHRLSKEKANSCQDNSSIPQAKRTSKRFFIGPSDIDIPAHPSTFRIWIAITDHQHQHPLPAETIQTSASDQLIIIAYDIVR
jgi:hypothetical protein